MNSNENIIEYSYNKNKSWGFLLFGICMLFVLIFFTIITYIQRNKGFYKEEIHLNQFTFKLSLCFTAIMSILFVPSALYYWIISRNKILNIDIKNSIFNYRKNDFNIKFSKSDILFCTHIKGHNYPNSWSNNFEFLNIHTTLNKTIVLTSLIGNIDKIKSDLGVNCNEINSFNPILNQIFL